MWLEFNPQAGHEQAGNRPALVISPATYNRRVGLALFCPLTTQVKGYPFEVVLPFGLKAADRSQPSTWPRIGITGMGPPPGAYKRA